MEEYYEETLDLLGVEAGDRWRYRDRWRLENYEHSRALGRVSYMLADIVEAHTRGEPTLALASSILAWKAVHQAAQDRDRWNRAWLLNRIVDPYKEYRFAGTEKELIAVSGYATAEDALKNRLNPKGLGKGIPEVEGDATGADDKDAGGAKWRKPRNPKVAAKVGAGNDAQT